MLWTLPTSSHFWPDWPTPGGRFHKLLLHLALTTYIFPNSGHFWSYRPTSGGGCCKPSLDLPSLTFYQPMIEFSSHSNHLHIANQLAFLVRLANFRRWLCKPNPDLPSLTFYQPMVEFSSHSNHFHIVDQLAFLVRLANFRRWFSQTESRFDLSKKKKKNSGLRRRPEWLECLFVEHP